MCSSPAQLRSRLENQSPSSTTPGDLPFDWQEAKMPWQKERAKTCRKCFVSLDLQNKPLVSLDLKHFIVLDMLFVQSHVLGMLHSHCTR